MMNKNTDAIEKRRREIEARIGDKTFYFEYKRYLVGFNFEDLNRINKEYGKDKNIEIVDIADMTPSCNCILLTDKPYNEGSFYKLFKIFNIDDVEDIVGITSNLLRYGVELVSPDEIMTIDEFAERMCK